VGILSRSDAVFRMAQSASWKPRPAIDDAECTRGERIAAERAIEWLRALSTTWTDADVSEAKADVLHATYDQIVVTGREIVSVRLTPRPMPMA